MALLLVLLLLVFASPAAAQEPLPLYVAAPTDFQPAPGGKVTYAPGRGQTGPLPPGATAFTRFVWAVAAPNTNGRPRNTVVIAPGTFDVLVPRVDITRNLTIRGAGSNATILRPTMNDNDGTPATDG